MNELDQYTIEIRGYRDVGFVFKTGPAVVNRTREVVSGPWPKGTRLELITLSLYGRQVPCVRATKQDGTPLGDYELKEPEDE